MELTWDETRYREGGSILMFTGHRPQSLGGYSAYSRGGPLLQTLFTLARQYLLELQPKEVVVGMAQGWDTAGALAAIDLGIPLVVAVAFPGVERRWPRDAQLLFHSILGKATQHIVCQSMNLSAGQMLNQRNIWMLENSSGVLALWNGEERGGTYNCVRDAVRMERPIVNVWGEYLESI